MFKFSKKCHYSISFYFLFFLAFHSNATIFVLSEDGGIFDFNSSSNSFALVEEPQVTVESEDYQIVDDGQKVEKRNGNSWTDVGLTSPPSGIIYSKVVESTEGLAVLLGGRGRGFNFLSDEKVIVSSRMEWSGEAPIVLDVAYNPLGNGFFAKSDDGKLLHVIAPTGRQRNFRYETVEIEGSVKNIISDREVILVVLEDGNIARVEKEGENYQAPLLNLDSANLILVDTLNNRLTNDLFELSKVRSRQQGQDYIALHNAIDASHPFFNFIDKVITDDIFLERQEGKSLEIFGREKEVSEVFDTLIRLKGKNPVLVGEAGVGKTAIAELLAQKILDADIPHSPVYRGELDGAYLVETSASTISKNAKSDQSNAQAVAVDNLLSHIQDIEKRLGKPIIVFIDEMHQFSDAQLQALKKYLDSKSGIRFIGATTNNELTMLINRDDAIKRRLQPISVPEFDEETTKRILIEVYKDLFEKRYQVSFSDTALDEIVRIAPEYLSYVHRPDNAIKLMQDVAISVHRKNLDSVKEVTPYDVGSFVAHAQDLNLNPYDGKEFITGLENLRERLKERMVDQEHIADHLVDEWRSANLSSGKSRHRVLLFAGPTGSGKSHGARVFAKEVLGSEERLLEIDGNTYSTGDLAINTLLGSPAGTVSSDETIGVLPEFLDGRGKRANVIVINELDKAHPDFAKAIMEMLDTGEVHCQTNGKKYYLGKSIVIFTTNKGDERIYPRGTGQALSSEEIKRRALGFSDADIREFFMQADSTNLYDTSKQLPPSFLNRVDVAAPMLPPSREGALKIARFHVKDITKNLSERFGYEIQVDDSVLEYVVEASYIPEDGVRDFLRTLKKLIDASVARSIEHEAFDDQLNISLSIPEAEKDEKAQVQLLEIETKKSLLIDAPKNIRNVFNPLINPDERSRLLSLEERLKKHVIGQDDAIDMAARSIRTRAVNPNTPQPASMLFLGPTGTGKTELAKALAKEVFGDSGRMKAFDMGSVKTKGDLQNIFGAPQGFAGSQSPSAFEQFLIDFPEGGVVTFDEIGNMGGKTGFSQSKEELLKVFYSILDEGKWTNAHGKTYDLSKYCFVFTSNEGEEHFQSHPSDDLRMTVWEENKVTTKLFALLRSHGWPEALINRFQRNITLYKPLLLEERIEIAKKQVDKIVSDLVTQHGVKGIEFDDNFYKVLAHSFFSHSEGARALRAFAEGPLVDLIGRAIIENYDPEFFASQIFTLALDDSSSRRNFYYGDIAPKRELTLRLKLSSKKIYEEDVSEFATQKTVFSKDDLISTAYHEAGHVIANDETKTGSRLNYVTIKAEGDYGGYARFEKSQNLTQNRTSVVGEIARILGGVTVERLMNYERNSGWQSDWKSARAIAMKAVVEWGISEESLLFRLTPEGEVDAKDPKVQEEIAALLNEGEELAESRLRENWSELRYLVADLIKNESLDKKALEVVFSKARAREAKYDGQKKPKIDCFKALGKLSS